MVTQPKMITSVSEADCSASDIYCYVVGFVSELYACGSVTILYFQIVSEADFSQLLYCLFFIEYLMCLEIMYQTRSFK